MKSFIFFASILLISLSSCKDSNSSNDEGKSDTMNVEENPSTMAYILKQPHELDKDNPQKITGDFIAVDSYDVPADFPPQGYYIKFEGPTWENDMVSYRFYTDARHRFDIFGKKVTGMVMDTVSLKYHDLADWGADILKVGESYGMGSPAIIVDDSTYFFEQWDKKIVAVVNNTGSSTVKASFTGLQLGEIKMDVVQELTIYPGNPYTKSEIIVSGDLPEGMKIGTGLVKHPAVSDAKNLHESGYIALYSWGAQSYHDQNLGMAVMSTTDYHPEIEEDELSFIMQLTPKEGKATYYLMADWSEGVNGSPTEEAYVENLKKYSQDILSK